MVQINDDISYECHTKMTTNGQYKAPVGTMIKPSSSNKRTYNVKKGSIENVANNSEPFPGLDITINPETVYADVLYGKSFAIGCNVLYATFFTG